MDKQNTHAEHKHPGYGIYILVWLGLLALTGVTVTVAGINFGGLTILKPQAKLGSGLESPCLSRVS